MTSYLALIRAARLMDSPPLPDGILFVLREFDSSLLTLADFGIHRSRVLGRRTFSNCSTYLFME